MVSSRTRCLEFAISPETFFANFQTYDIISFVNLHHPSSHLASEDVTRDSRVARKHHIHLQEVERANGMVLGWGKCWTSDLSQPRFQHFVRHYFRLSAGVSALQLSPVGVTSQYTTERTTNKQFTALTALNTALLSLREYNKPIENDQILQWSTFSVVELSLSYVITALVAMATWAYNWRFGKFGLSYGSERYAIRTDIKLSFFWTILEKSMHFPFNV